MPNILLRYDDFINSNDYWCKTLIFDNFFIIKVSILSVVYNFYTINIKVRLCTHTHTLK